MYTFEINPTLLLALVAGGLALAFDYLPNLRQWFDQQTPEKKRILNVALVSGVALVLYVGQCVGVFDTNLTCELKSALDLVQMVFLAVTINQGVHAGLKPTPALQARLLK